ncbi:MAG: hypothetical protein ACKPCP_07795, partial [Sphaerospermopsis kisseleviana]
SSERFKALTKFTNFEQIVDPIRYGYAITGYGAQGLSVDTVYKNWSDISCQTRDFDNRNRTNFVADSRARYRINVF